MSSNSQAAIKTLARRIARGLSVAGICLLLSSMLPIHSAEPAQRVRWYDVDMGDLQPATVDAWRDALSQPWRNGNSLVTFVASKEGEDMTVDSCDTLFTAVTNEMRAYGTDGAIFDGWAVTCYAAKVLVDGVGPKKNFLGKFPLNENGVKALPVGLAFTVSREEEETVAALASRRGTLGDFLPNMTLKAVGKSENRTVVVNDGTGSSQFIRVLAEGDFDHDGINDLLISSSNSLRGGSYHASHLYIVSRLKVGGPLVLRKKVM